MAAVRGWEYLNSTTEEREREVSLHSQVNMLLVNLKGQEHYSSDLTKSFSSLVQSNLLEEKKNRSGDVYEL
jgi:hypothetical protein